MVDRVTTARLRADASQFMREMAKAAAAAEAFERSLGNGSTNLGNMSRDLDHAASSTDDWRSSMDGLNRSSESMLGHLESMDNKLGDVNDSVRELGNGDSDPFRKFSESAGRGESRMETLTQAVLAFAPAIAPALAVATTGVVALGTQLTFAATGAGVAALAFNGVFDTVNKLNKVTLDPSETNIKNLRVAMEKLGPAQQEFVGFLQGLRKPLSDLQNLAGQSFLPGLQKGMESLSTLGPQVNSIVERTGIALGQLAIEGGNALNNPEWSKFFDFLASDANNILVEMGRTIGNFVQALGSIMVAFQPLTDGFSAGLLQMSRDFAGWAANLGDTQGFSDFVNYIRDVTPQVLDAIGSLANAFIDIGKATAPIQGPTLGAIEGLARGISAFMDSPAGPILVSVAAGLAAISTALKVGSWLGASRVFGLLESIPTTMTAATASMTAFQAKSTAVAASLGGWRSAAVRGAGAAALIGVSMTDLGDSAVANTLSFGAMGAMLAPAGPWGVAIGASAGFLKDAAAGNNALETSLQAVSTAMRDQPSDFQAQTDALGSMNAEFDKFKASVADDQIFNPAAYKNVIEGWFGSSDVEEAQAKIEATTTAQSKLKGTFSDLRNEMEGGKGLWTDYTGNVGALTETATGALPVLEKMGVTIDEVQKIRDASIAGDPAAQAQWDSFIEKFKSTESSMDSVGAHSQAVRDAIIGLDGSIGNAASSADALAASLSSLLGPELGLIAAQDAWAAGLDHLGESLDKSNKSLVGQNDAARQNRAAVGDLANNFVGLATAQAKAGAGSEQIARSISRQRDSLISAGVAAGLSRKQLEHYLTAIGLTPKLVSTLFKQLGINEAEDSARNLVDRYNKLPKEVRTNIKQNGAPESAKQIDALAKKYKLTPAEVRTIVEMIDKASGKIDFVKGKLTDINGYEADPKLNADSSSGEAAISHMRGGLEEIDRANPSATLTAQDNATPIINTAMAALNWFDGQNASATLTTNRVTVYSSAGNNSIGSSATGGLIRGPGGPTDDMAGLYRLSDQEFVNKAASTSYYGPDALYRINDMQADRGLLRKAVGLAEGGLAGGGRPRDSGPGRRWSADDIFDRTLRGDVMHTLKDLTKAFREMRDEAKDVTKAERQLKAAREAVRQVNGHLNDTEKDRSKAEDKLAKTTDNLASVSDKINEQRKAGAEVEKELEKVRNQIERERAKNKPDKSAIKDLLKEEQKLARQRANGVNPALIRREHQLTQEREDAQRAVDRLRESDRASNQAKKAADKDLQRAEDALSKQRSQLADATGKWRDIQQELLSNAAAYSQAITQNGDIFGGNGTSVSAAGILAKLTAAGKDAARFRKDIAILRNRGVDENLIQQLLDQGSTPEGVQAVHNLATASRSMLNRINAQQSRLERIGASVGTWGVQSGGGGGRGNVTVNITGPIHTTDVHKLARELPQHIRRALRIASMP